ncbi:hypothetical protein BUALT_Bualt03G0212100 [Buddleja alternifolia]|uniref:DUF4378 domain-containing protein n=1 Tax=Buddleja alternifolia TaxID=168488 RepID=A0AAV6XWD6_9LAMI|nr:hypothetical protein BUALT_Bualt03G0212100 [Buddleja alternifolia]
MDCRKRWQENSRNSVIGTLMGLHELPSQQPFHEKHRVLSESYIDKAASIGLRPGSSLSTRRSSSANSQIVHGVKCVSEVQISKIKHDHFVEKCANSNTSKVKPGKINQTPSRAPLSKSFSRARDEDRKLMGQKGEHCALGNVLRDLQKLDHDLPVGDRSALGIDYMNKSLKSQLETLDKPSLVSNSIGPPKPMSKNITYDLVSPRTGCIVCPRNLKRISRQERQRSKFDVPSSLANGCKNQSIRRWNTAKDVQEVVVSGMGQTLKEVLALADEKSTPRNLNHGLGKKGLSTLSSLQSSSLGSCSPSVFSSIDIRENDHIKGLPVLEFEAMGETLPSGWDLKQDESTSRDNYSEEQKNSQKDVLEPKGEKDLEQFKGSAGVNDTSSLSSELSELSNGYISCSGSEYSNPEASVHGSEMDNSSENDSHREIAVIQRDAKSSFGNLSSKYINDDMLARAEAVSIGVCSRINGDHQSEPSTVVPSGEGGHASYVREVFSREASLNEFSEEESSHSNFSKMGPPKFQHDLKRTNQHSPDSVLEPLDVQIYSSFEHFENIGLRLQLQDLNFKPEENYSEGSVMVISGDEDTEENIDDLAQEGRNVKTWFGDDQSRNFSYLVDVLDESEIFGKKSFMDFKKWHSLDCPINSFIFEALEKKYGKQTSWKKSERQLLFDRINSGLVDIFYPVIHFHSSMKRRVCSSWRRDEVEDELWMVLISQEKEKRKDYLSEKALGNWLEFEEGIHIICRELETSIFDELVNELVSLWD